MLCGMIHNQERGAAVPGEYRNGMDLSEGVESQRRYYGHKVLQAVYPEVASFPARSFMSSLLPRLCQTVKVR